MGITSQVDEDIVQTTNRKLVVKTIVVRKSAGCKAIPVRLWVCPPNATFVQWLVQNLAKVWMRVQFSQVAPVLKCIQQFL